MASSGARSAAPEARRSAREVHAARNCKRDFLRIAHGLSMATVAARLSAVADRVLLLSALATGRDVGTHPHDVARASAASARAQQATQRCHPGQPEREDDGKRGPRGYDAGKKINGRKRHLLVDTQGFVLEAHVQKADLQDRDGGKPVLEPLREKYTRLSKIWADGGYSGALVDWVYELRQGRGRRRISLEIVRKPKEGGFVVLPKRWIVERTFGWLGRSRRMSKDYEELTDSSQAWIWIAMIQLMARRLALAHS